MSDEAKQFFEKKCKEAKDRSQIPMPPSAQVRDALYLIDNKEGANLFFEGYVEMLDTYMDDRHRRANPQTTVELAAMNLAIHIGGGMPYDRAQMWREVLRSQQTNFQRGALIPKGDLQEYIKGVIDEEGSGK